ncbi:unnamed protein product [Heligmosomoides polygyrus]|uniref:DDE_3 domain-containing protein n=1 Tax=Heligmosomoides polygyrus TaxID=6339 RepID=A0A3P8A5M5_HELPZ|nr:unnamed protein product [Heligmosomoides polygyrus]
MDPGPEVRVGQRCKGRHKRCFDCQRIEGTAFEDLIPIDEGQHGALGHPRRKRGLLIKLYIRKDEKYVFYLNPAKQPVWVRAGELLPTFVRRDVHGEKHLQSFWVCAHGPVYWKLFTKSTTMDSKDMVNEMEEMDLRLELIQSQRAKKVLLFDNAAPHREQVTMDKPDISPCDYQHFLSLRDFLVGRDTRI